MCRFELLLAAMALAVGTAMASGPVHWDYDGAEGPEHWGSLAPEFSLCASGRNQSPVDLGGLVDADLPPLTFAYQAGGKEVVNNGHTVQVNFAPGSTLTVNGHDYTLKQFHFHAPSENHIGGQSFPMEAHLVHADAEGNLAVVAVMFERGEANPVLAAVWDKMPERVDETRALKSPVPAYDLLPPRREYFRFSGSLTTPPCSEGVLWLVMKEPVAVSEDQVSRFSFAIGGHPNNRPVQPLNARVVLE